MDYFLNETQKAFQDVARKVAKEKIEPVRDKYDRSGEFPWDMVKVFAECGFYGVFIPEEYDGIGGGVLDTAIITEQLSYGCGGIALAFAATALGTYPILIGANNEQKKRFLPRIASGSSLAAFALTEPQAGSDAGAVKTTAVRKGDRYVLNGTKQWITNGGEAEINTVLALTQPERGTRGMSAFVVEKGTKGFSFGKKEDKMGIRASATRELIFEDCEVPAENLIGQEGYGFSIAMKTLDKARPGVAAQAVGIAQAALDVAVKYAGERVQFGKPIGAFQGISFMLADMATQVEAARALVYSAARYIDSGAKDVSKVSSMSKLFATDTAMRVTTDAVQVLGGYGYMKDYPTEKMMRDAKITQIYEGTNQIQRLVIGNALLKEVGAKL